MKTTPYWWEEAPRVEQETAELPSRTDVLVIGAGYTGLNAARTLARGGRDVLICESHFPGYGASTRNGGMLGPSFHKLGIDGLTAHFGTDRANAILRESVGFVDFVSELIDQEYIDCEFRRCGRFRCASHPKHFAQMARDLETQIAATGVVADLVPREQVHDEIGSNRFYGGIRYQIDGALHPAKYYDGLLRVALEAGAMLAARAEVTSVTRNGGAFAVTTSRGNVLADQVAVCTNAYTGRATPWFRRRIVPVRSAMIATEPLAPDLMQRLMPTGRCYGDTRRIMAYYRPSPDGTRILFGGRAVGPGEQPHRNARDLKRMLSEVFPELADTQITHSWSGLVGYPFDHVPHLGQHDGLYYAMGYCGSGVARASYFGTRLGYKMLGDDVRGRTAFDDLEFRSRPMYTGNPWFMPAVVLWHRSLDRLGL